MRPLALIAVVLSLIALGVALFRGGEPPAPAPAPSPEPSPELAAYVEELETRVRYLESANEQLARRITSLERRPAASLGSDGGMIAAEPMQESVAAELAELRAEVRSMVAGEALHSEGGKEYLREAVREVQQELETERRQQAIQRAQQREAAAAAERAERWKKFATEAQLSYAQEQELNRRIALEDERRKAMFEELRAGTREPRSMRQEYRALREETDAAMKQTLSEEQYAKYRETRREDRPGRGGWGGGGGRNRD